MIITMILVKFKTKILMKKLFILALASLFAFASCSKESNETPEVKDNNTVNLTFTSKRPQLKSESKTAWNGSTIVWSEGDKIRVGYTLDGNWMGQKGAGTAKFYQSSEVSIDETDYSIGTFCVPTNFEDQGSGSYIFYGYYPQSANSNSDQNNAPSVDLTVPTFQTPQANSFDAAADVMLGKTASLSLSGLPTDPIEINWSRLVAHLDLTFKNLAFDGAETISSITLTANEDSKLTGIFTVDVTNGTMSAASSNVVVMEGAHLVANSGNVEAWCCVLPVTVTSLDVEVVTDKAKYTRQISGISKTFKQNARNTLAINMSSAERTEQSVVYELYSGTISEGDYVIVYDGAAMKNTVSSNRLQYSDVTISENKIANPASDIVWHIAPSGAYWTIYNAAESKYAAATTSNNQAQLLADGTDDKSLWTVSGNSTYDFVNKSNSRYLRRNTTYGFACYGESTGGALSLYKLADNTPRFSVVSPLEISAAEYSNNINITRHNFTGALTIDVPSECDWIVADDNIAENATSFEILVEENTGVARTATLTISGTGVESQTLVVNQAGISVKTLPFEETFASGQGDDFTIDNVALDGLSQVWSYDTNYKYMKASGYANSTNHVVESWLVSPVIVIPSLSAGESVKLKFSQVISNRFGTVEDEATLMVKESGGAWSKIAISYPTITSGNYSAWDDQTIDLSSFAGKNIQFAFKYVGTSSHNGNWEIKNVSVKKYEPIALSSISVSDQKTIFTVGDAFEFGGKVTATYNDETTADVTSSSVFSGYDMSTTGPQTVTVSYTEGGVTKTTTYNITVSDPETLSLKYTLDGTITATGNAYASASSVTQGGINWDVTANTEQNPWRVGGKGITDEDRVICSKTAISSNISKITVESGATASNLTVNSVTISVHNSATDAASGSNAIATKTFTSDIASSTITFDKEGSTSWANKYYRIVYNVTRTSTSGNGYITFVNAKFYGTN